MAEPEELNPVEAQEYLAGMNYPADRSQIVDRAKTNGANEEIITFLERIPEGTYHSPADVSESLGETHEPGMDDPV